MRNCGGTFCLLIITLRHNKKKEIQKRDIHFLSIDLKFAFLFALVVAQSYEVEADNEYVIRGNSAVMKCEVPSFVSDFVTVDIWRDSQGNTYKTGENYGKTLD